MTRAQTYACRYAEGDKSYDSLVALFEAAMREGANRARAAAIQAIRAVHDREMWELDNLPTWEVRGAYERAITGDEAT